MLLSNPLLFASILRRTLAHPVKVNNDPKNDGLNMIGTSRFIMFHVFRNIANLGKCHTFQRCI